MKKIIFLFLFCMFKIPCLANPYCIDIDWFKNFSDDKLFDYVLLGIENNKDVLIAKKNILKYRQEKNIKISDEFPNINVGANYLLTKVPKLAIPNNDIQTNSFALPFFSFWEIDYLLKNYNKVQKARLDIENKYYDLKAVNLMVAVDVASDYFNISNLDKQISIQKNILFLVEDLYKKNKRKFDFGIMSKNEINYFEDLVLKEKNNLKNLYKKRAVFLDELTFLIGNPPSFVDEIKVSDFDEINYDGKYFDSLKGDVILNRPDILKAENEIKKSKLDITIAKKDFLPSINLFGILAFSTIVQNFNWQGALASLSVGAIQNLFDGGMRIFTFKKRKIEYEQKIEEYLKADLLALKEVNDSLYTLKKDLEIYENNLIQTEILNDNFVRVFNSYKSGAKSYLDYIEENKKLLEQRAILSDLKNQNFNNLLSLYKVLGGVMPQ